MAESGRGESSLRRGTDPRRAPVLQRPALRWAAVAAGVAVVAGSATQAVGTLAAPLAVRTAGQDVATANYFPAPLPTNLTCTNNGVWGSRSVTLNWTAPPRPAGAAAYRYRVTWLLDGVTQKYTFDTANTTTGAFRIRDQLSVGDSTGTSFRITVKTINPVDTGVVSSGFAGWTVESPTAPSTRCLDNSGTRVENAAWENQLEWSPGAGARTGRSFVSLADELVSGALAEVLPPEDELGGLTDVPLRQPAPEQTPDATSTSSADGADSGDGADPSGADTSTAPGGGAEAGETSTPAAPGDGSAPTPSGPAAPGGDSSDAESPGPGSPGSGTSGTDDSSGPTAPTDTSGPTVALGAGPLSVGAVEARLEAVDGRPVVTVSSGGVAVCTADVPGATAITNSGGVLMVLGPGADRVVDTASCEVG